MNIYTFAEKVQRDLVITKEAAYKRYEKKKKPNFTVHFDNCLIGYRGTDSTTVYGQGNTIKAALADLIDQIRGMSLSYYIEHKEFKFQIPNNLVIPREVK